MIKNEICTVIDNAKIDRHKLLDVCLTICTLQEDLDPNRFLAPKVPMVQYRISDIFPFLQPSTYDKSMSVENFSRVLCDAVVLLCDKDMEGIYTTLSASKTVAKWLGVSVRHGDYKYEYELGAIVDQLLLAFADYSWLYKLDNYISTLEIPSVRKFFDNDKCRVPVDCRNFTKGKPCQDLQNNIYRCLLSGISGEILKCIEKMIESNSIKANLYVKRVVDRWSGKRLNVGVSDLSSFGGAIHSRLCKLFSPNIDIDDLDELYKIYSQIVLDRW